MTEIEAIQAVTKEQVGRAFRSPTVPCWKWALAATILTVVGTFCGGAVLIELGYIIYMIATDLWAFKAMTLYAIGVAALVAVVWWCIGILTTPTTAGEVGE